ncbi:hypothetical protein FB192DRAFT_1387672 [Mucor lusitanicus]|uniref:Uncharacterized protein n=1 Tax=Mucor circinelloides f. lusitanicus TaxID=29924 RepID=A0A8H4BCE1_MUCCL|nr:hypothetical protein FB192DRAFT_1387672 [Mucor lusitanicus]
MMRWLDTNDTSVSISLVGTVAGIVVGIGDFVFHQGIEHLSKVNDALIDVVYTQLIGVLFLVLGLSLGLG